MKKVILYHNPRCSKSRQALQLLQENNVNLDVVEYLKHPLDEQALTALLKKLKLTPRDVIRNTETVYKAFNLGNTELSDQQLIQTIVKEPILLQRPIAVCGNKAIIGRPPELVRQVVA